MGHEGDGADSGKGGSQPNGSFIEDLSLASLVPNEQSTQLANIESNKPEGVSTVPEKFFLTHEEFFQKVTKIGFEENLGSAQRIRETDPEKIAKAIQPGDIIRIDNNDKSFYYRVSQDAAGNKWVTGDGKNFDPLGSVLRDNQGARIMRSPRKLSV
ncbi:MAG: hypothetical protein SFY67_06930 [Candidatus Melainabacteria bacterium]|nr:hypothetical protein [Candidatus Melainabacteria bacterium]